MGERMTTSPVARPRTVSCAHESAAPVPSRWPAAASPVSTPLQDSLGATTGDGLVGKRRWEAPVLPAWRDACGPVAAGFRWPRVVGGQNVGAAVASGWRSGR
jgi:hypothetical protein